MAPNDQTYSVHPDRSGYTLERVYRLRAGAAHVDSFRTHSGAAHAAYLLNAGLAHVEPHRPTGCRVQPEPSAPDAAPALIASARAQLDRELRESQARWRPQHQPTF